MGKNLLKRIKILFLIMSCMSVCPVFAQGLLLFDSPFPPTAYTNVLGASVQVLNYLESLEAGTLVGQERILMQDAVFGSLMKLQCTADSFLSECVQGKLVLADDVDFLGNIVNRVEKLYKSTMPSSLLGHAVGDVTVSTIKAKLEGLLAGQ